MSKHTPGPWVIRPLGGKYYGTEIDVGQNLIVVWTPNHYLSPFASEREIAAGWEPQDGHDHIEDAESYANARLIAAAPDLLAALETIASLSMSQFYKPQDLGNAAIKLAAAAIAKATGKSE